MRCIGFSLSLVVLAGCGATWRRSVELLSDHQMQIELERLTEDGAPKDAGFSHPAWVTADRLAALLEAITYEEPTLLWQSDQVAVVDPPLVPKLATAISDGLRLAGPAERVRFIVFNTRYQFKVIPKTTCTRGVAFVDPAGTINIAFDLVDEHMDREGRSRHVTPDRWGDPTRFTESNVTLHLPPGAAVHRSPTGATHRLWVVGNIGAPAEQASPAPPAAPTRPPMEPAEALVKSEPPGEQEAVEYDALRGEEAIRLLKSLGDLRNKGILTEAEYQKKVEEVMARY